MVMASPFLHALRTSLDGELWAVGKSKAVHLYNGLDLFDRFLPLDSRGLLPFLDLVASLRRSEFRRAIALPHSFRSALLFFSAGVKERVGYGRNRRGLLLTHRVAESPHPEPTVEHYLKIIDSLGESRLFPSPLLLVTEDEEHGFDKKHTDIHRPYGVLVVGAEYGPAKCWPGGHFAKLADMIVNRLDMKVYILPGKGEERAARQVWEGAQRRDRVEIREMGIRDLKVCLSRASFCVSNDTGPRHIASALSVPTVVMVGPMDERYTRYPSPATRVLMNEVPCRPCNKKTCDRGHECMAGIAPDTVFSTLEELLGTWRSSEPDRT